MSQSYAGSWWHPHPTGDQSQAERHRFGGTELTDSPTNRRRLATFFDRLAERYVT
ncbi:MULTISPECIES: hypothetical protein [Actinosynnema]|uniref:hypothetical protein n=1 Tax=Actinosynnema TaxID=40566 RepID=UPI0020A32073|nr:hypothetical protein [Actinosynnema pretiosum]MCP2099994.1 hypothetical protein [Actinosynnema pretiosum]